MFPAELQFPIVCVGVCVCGCVCVCACVCVRAQSDKSSDLGEFLHRHLERQHREQAGDWAYSLMESFHQHSNDDVINLFYLILTGKVRDTLSHARIISMSCCMLFDRFLV